MVKASNFRSFGLALLFSTAALASEQSVKDFDFGHSNQWEFDQEQNILVLGGSQAKTNQIGAFVAPSLEFFQKWTEFSKRTSLWGYYGLSMSAFALSSKQMLEMDPSAIHLVDPRASHLSFSPAVGVGFGVEPTSWMMVMIGARISAYVFRQTSETNGGEGSGQALYAEPNAALILKPFPGSFVSGLIQVSYLSPLSQTTTFNQSFTSAYWKAGAGLGVSF